MLGAFHALNLPAFFTGREARPVQGPASSAFPASAALDVGNAAAAGAAGAAGATGGAASTVGACCAAVCFTCQLQSESARCCICSERWGVAAAGPWGRPVRYNRTAAGRDRCTARLGCIAVDRDRCTAWPYRRPAWGGKCATTYTPTASVPTGGTRALNSTADATAAALLATAGACHATATLAVAEADAAGGSSGARSHQEGPAHADPAAVPVLGPLSA